MTDLAGQVALVTGGSRGIGRAIVEELGRAGCRVAVVATTQAGADGGAEAATAAGGEGFGYAADVRDSSRANEIAADVVERWGGLDILINNAGITRDNLLMRMADEDVESVLDINLKGTLYFCRAVARPMTKKRKGSIVNISSIVGITGNAGQSNYAAAKAGIFGLTRSLAAEFGGRGVRVNAIAPGYIQTDMTADLPEAVRDESLKRIPLARLGEAGDIANAALFLCSDAASYITGTTVVVDGGMSL
ncbi:MAG: 3-oxoacyl-[acyl-carrier-protein] reductase [Planctomycetota bacterium]|jgi:3-oxoacyl-[acyl-carrier protein] reductase